MQLTTPSAVAVAVALAHCAASCAVGNVAAEEKSKLKSATGAERSAAPCFPYMSVALICSMSIQTLSLQRNALNAERSKPETSPSRMDAIAA